MMASPSYMCKLFKREANLFGKKIIDIIKKFNLRITVELGFQRIGFLNIILNLKPEKYWPYRKDNNLPLHIHSQSNHSINILLDRCVVFRSCIRGIS